MNEKWGKSLGGVKFHTFDKNNLGCGGSRDGSHGLGGATSTSCLLKNGNFTKPIQRGNANVAVQRWQEVVQCLVDQC